MRGNAKDLTRQIQECKDENERKRLDLARKEQEALTRSIKDSAYALPDGAAGGKAAAD